jgi:hypothetical protein
MSNDKSRTKVVNRSDLSFESFDPSFERSISRSTRPLNGRLVVRSVSLGDRVQVVWHSNEQSAITQRAQHHGWVGLS